MMKVVILKESEYNDLKVSIISALYCLNKQFPESCTKNELRQYLKEASAILDREDDE